LFENCFSKIGVGLMDKVKLLTR